MSVQDLFQPLARSTTGLGEGIFQVASCVRAYARSFLSIPSDFLLPRDCYSDRVHTTKLRTFLETACHEQVIVVVFKIPRVTSVELRHHSPKRQLGFYHHTSSTLETVRGRATGPSTPVEAAYHSLHPSCVKNRKKRTCGPTTGRHCF